MTSKAANRDQKSHSGAPAGDAPAAREASGPSFSQRFKAWWEGYELKPAPRPAEVTAAAPASAEPGTPGAPGCDRHGRPLWHATRLEVAEKLWGEGFIGPGREDYLPTLVKPLGLNPAMSVLDLGAGLGGTTRLMAGKFGAWVTGLEVSPLLVKEGKDRSYQLGLVRQAPIEAYDPEDFRYGKRVDAIFAKEAFFAVANKEGLIDGVCAALKPRGQLLFTDYVAEPEAADNRTFQSWLTREPQVVSPWSVAQYQAALEQRQLDLRICEDITDQLRHLILTSIQALTDHLAQFGLAQETKLHLLDEVELWAMRVAALQNGLRCYRFYALKPPE